MKLLPQALQSILNNKAKQPKPSVFKYTHLFLVSALFISACASKPEVKTAETPSETPQKAEATTATPVTKTDIKALNQKPLTPNFITQYLLAEIAGQRGDFATAGTIFYQLADAEQDPRFAERAAKTAAYGNIGSLVYPAVKLWVALDPASIEAQQAITELLIKGNRISDAEPHLAKLLEKEDTRARGFLFINNILSKSPDKQAALELAQSLAARYPSLPEAHFAIAQAAAASGDQALAIDELTVADTLLPGWNLAALLKGQLLYVQSPQSATDFYGQFLIDHPDKNEIRLNYAKILVSQGQYVLAKEQFPTIISHAQKAVEKAESDSILASNKKAAKQQANKNLADTTAVIGLLAFQSEDYPSANSYFQQALDLNYQDPEQIYLYFGQSAEQQNKPKIAREWYDKITTGQHFLSAKLNTAQLIKKEHTVDEAIEYLDTIDHLTTEQQVIAIQTQASMLHDARRHHDAYDHLKKAVQTIPESPPLIYDYALAAEKMHKYDLMETQLRHAIKVKPDFAAAYNALGYSFADRNIHLEEALTLIEKALSLKPNDHYMMDSLGWVYYKQGNFEQAVVTLQKAYNVQADPEIAAHLGEVLWKQGQHEQARKIWDAAINKNPDNALLISTAKKFNI